MCGMKAAQSQSPMDGVAWTSGHLGGDREEMGDGHTHQVKRGGLKDG